MLKKNKKIIAALLALFLIAGSVAIAAEVIKRPDVAAQGTWRYKITVSVETPEGIKTGSAVREVTITKGYVSPPEATASKESKGEAVVVDLGKRGVLFALTSFDDYRTVFEAFPFPRGGTTAEGIKHYSQLKNVKATLTPPLYPSFVTFKDLNDPKSVELVTGHEFDAARQEHIPVDNFEKMFGEGVKLKEITIEMTDEPVTWGIEKWLPWIGTIKSNLDGTRMRSSNTLSNALDVGHFKRGERTHP